MAELEELEQEELDKNLLEISGPETVPLPNVPSISIPSKPGMDQPLLKHPVSIKVCSFICQFLGFGRSGCRQHRHFAWNCFLNPKSHPVPFLCEGHLPLRRSTKITTPCHRSSCFLLQLIQVLCSLDVAQGAVEVWEKGAFSQVLLGQQGRNLDKTPWGGKREGRVN